MKSISSSFLARSAAIAGTTIVFALPLSAQTPQAAPAAAPSAQVSCDIDNSKPQAITRATFSLTRAMSAQKTGSPVKDLKDVIGSLNAPGFKDENPVARAYILGQAYVTLLDQPDIQPIVPRASIGLTTDPTGTIDLFAAADTMWKVVEAVSPGCAQLAQQWRQQKAWMNVTNAAINALNAGKLDSADLLARRALLLDRKAPYAYSIIAAVAKNKKDFNTANEYWKQTLAAAGTDTSFNDIRERTLYDMASTATTRAEQASPAERKTLARPVIDAWNAVFTNTDDDMQRSFAVQQLAKYYIIAGDSVSLPKIYAPIAANPTKYGELTLMQAGVVASTSKHPDEAAKMFNAVLATNPYQRDALNNLAASYIFTNQYDKVFPLVTRLTDIDPSNPDNWMLSAYSYAGLLKTNKTGKLNKQYTDSLVYYSGKADKMPVKLTVTEFTRAPEATTLGGTIENKGTAAKTFNLSVDFLDKSGQVVSTETTSVGPVAPKGSKEFKVKTAKGGIAAFRYKPII
ncbi:MAG TPA: FxLYD domain-containing protein [Gemmatimonadaceae bacterium]|nr:FxLYD domain-containing protein [Gemmatimonadaceae bacterium]